MTKMPKLRSEVVERTKRNFEN